MTSIKSRCGRELRIYAGAPGQCGRPQGHSGTCMSAESWQRQLDPAYRAGHIRTHGYSGYSNGCRCETCRAAKADYMARRRADAYVTDSAPETDPDITHGTRFAYEERGCRCAQCRANQETCSRYARGRVA